jgi:hypothetical protein
VPDSKDFTDAAILLGGFHAAGHIGGKLRDVYSKTGLHPVEAYSQAQANPTIAQDLASDNIEIPRAFDPDMAHLQGVPIKPDSNLNAHVEGLNPEFTDDTPALVKKSEGHLEGVSAGEGGGATEISDSAKKVLSRVGDKETGLTKEPMSFKRFYEDRVDKFDPIKRDFVDQLVKDPKKLDTVENPYELARMADDYQSKAKHMFDENGGMLDYNTLETTGPSLAEVMKPALKNIDELKAVLVSKRALEIEATGRKSGVDLEAAREVVKEASPEALKAAQGMTEFSNGALKYLKDSGRLDQKAYDNMIEAGKSYISFKRLDETNTPVGGTSRGKPIKSLQGSELKIANPIESTFDNAVLYIKLAEQNRAARAAVELQEKYPDTQLITKDETPSHTLGENQFEVWRNGVRETWTTTSPALGRALKAFEGDAASTSLIFKLAKGAATGLRFGTAITPDFITRNFFRDQLTAGAFTKARMIPFWDAAVAAKDIMTKSKPYYDWLKSGGAGGAFMSLDKDYMENDIYKLSKETGLMDKVWNVVSTPLHYMKVGSELLENSTRLAEFKRASGGNSDAKSLMRGGMAAREVTVDFLRMGAKQKAWNAITAFQNAQIQGVDRSIRAFKDDPLGTSIRTAAGVVLPSVLLWYANKDDKRMDEVPAWEKNLFWHIGTDNWQPLTKDDQTDMLPDYYLRNNKGVQEINRGHIFRIPKPQEIGLIGTFVERALDAFVKDEPQRLSSIMDSVSSVLTPAWIPNIAISPAETYMNKSLFTGAPIVPKMVENDLPEYRYTNYTSEFSKQISKLVATVPHMKHSAPAPATIDNWIQNLSGATGKYTVQLIDKALISSGIANPPVKPESTLKDIPFVAAWVTRHPTMGMDAIREFQDRERQSEEVANTIKHLGKTLDVENMQKEFESPANRDNLIKLASIKEAMSNATKNIQLVYHLPEKDDKGQIVMSASDKRQAIDGWIYMANEIAKQGNAVFAEMEKINAEEAKQQRAQGRMDMQAPEAAAVQPSPKPTQSAPPPAAPMSAPKSPTKKVSVKALDQSNPIVEALKKAEQGN